MIKKMLELSFVILLLVNSPLTAQEKSKCGTTVKECRKTLDDLCIDPDIKSIIGWRRVCNNHKLLLYMCNGTKVVSKLQTEKACYCLENKDDIEPNSFYIFDKGSKK